MDSPAALVYGLIFIITSILCILSMYKAMDMYERELKIPLAVLLFSAGVWALSEFFQIIVDDTLIMEIIYGIGLSFGIITVPAWFYFCSVLSNSEYHKFRWLRISTIIALALMIIIKLTNPIHGLYFTLGTETEPFTHIVVEAGPLHFSVTLFSYIVALFGYYLLLDRFWETDYITDIVIILVLMTIPAIFSFVHITSSIDGFLLEMSYESVGVGLFSVIIMLVLKNSMKEMRASTFRRVLDKTSDPIVLVSKDYDVMDYNEVAFNEIPDITVDVIGENIENVFDDRLKRSNGSVVYDTKEDRYIVERVNLDVTSPNIESAIVFELEQDIEELEEYMQIEKQKKKELSDSLTDIDENVRFVERQIENKINRMSDKELDEDFKNIMDRIYEINDKITAVKTGVEEDISDEKIKQHNFESLVYSALTTVETGKINVSVGRAGSIKCRRSQLLAIVREATRKAIREEYESIVFTYNDGIITITAGAEEYGPNGDLVSVEEILPITDRILSLVSWELKDALEYEKGFRIRIDPNPD